MPVSIAVVSTMDVAVCDKSWCREGVREGTQVCQLRLETAPALLGRFLITGVELREVRGDRKGGARPWGG